MTTRVFLGWHKPCSELAVEYFVKRYAAKDEVLGEVIDLSRTIVALPGRRATRRLIELLVERTAGRLIPPRTISLGELPELLIPEVSRARPHASILAQKIAWARALRSCTPQELESLTPQPPPYKDEAMLEWIRLGECCASVWRELSNGNCSFAEARTRAEEMSSFCEESRWDLLSSLYDRYLNALDEMNLADPMTEYMRVAAERSAQCEGDLILVGAADLSPLFRGMLRSKDLSVTALIGAPAEEQDNFDEVGALVKERWTNRTVPVPESRVYFGDDEHDEARYVMRALASLPQPLNVDRCTVGFTQESLLSAIEYAGSVSGVPVRAAAERPLAESAPSLFLRALQPLLSGSRFEAIASFVRHPATEALLRRCAEKRGEEPIADAASLLDGYHHRHLPQYIHERLTVHDDNARDLSRLCSLVKEVCEPFQGRALPWREFYGHLLKLLHEAFPSESDPAAEHMYDAAIRVCEEGAALAQHVLPPLSGSAHLSLFLSMTADLVQPGEGHDHAVEMLGWLELLHDDAPFLVVAGMNEGNVPEAITSDAFLPDGLRRHLGLKDNDARYVRDVYALTALFHSRTLFLTASRHGARGDMLRLSRLLLADEPAIVAARIARFYGEAPHALPSAERRAPARFPFPVAPAPVAPITALSVTAFADYLRCPYRFYLSHVRKLRRVDDAKFEMDALLYGELTHEVLGKFGVSEVRESTRVEVIGEYLAATLAECARRRFGTQPLPAVIIQLRNIEDRLLRFAEWQASWTREGWRIVQVEFPLEAPHTEVQIAGEPFTIRGRIDRIDRHEDGRVLLFDYKTSEEGGSPEKTHQKKDEWVNLQLPLYYYLAPACLPFELSSAPQVGFINLSKKNEPVKELIAGWSDDEYSRAWSKVEEVVQAVRAQKFWPPAEVNAAFDEYAVLCGGDNREDASEEEEGEDAA